jgi:hypothetical protein
MNLISRGEQGHKLNFSEEADEDLHFEPIGVAYDTNREKWRAYRWSSKERKKIEHGWYSDEETAAHASDYLARKLIADGSQGHELNFPDTNETFVPYIKAQAMFPDDYAEVYPEKPDDYFKDAKTEALASDTLAKQLLKNYDYGNKLIFPEDDTEVFPEAYTEVYPEENCTRKKKTKNAHERRKALIKALEADFNADEGPLIQAEEEIEPSKKWRNKLKRSDDLRYGRNKRKRSFDYP